MRHPMHTLSRGCFYVPETSFAGLLSALSWLGADGGAQSGILVFLCLRRRGAVCAWAVCDPTEILDQAAYPCPQPNILW